MRICQSCGIIAPFAKNACSGCNAPFTSAPPIEAPGRTASSVLFACVHESDFACTACGMRSPMGHVELGGQAECMRCGLTQMFDPVQWREALVFAHGVADLSGPNPEGANPIPNQPIHGRSRHAKIGTEYTSSTKKQQSTIMDGRGTRTHTLKTTVSPGHPLCKTCRVPLEVALDNNTTRTRCPRCNDSASYDLPPNSLTTYPKLRGVLAAQHRTDKPIARVTRGQGGMESLACPQCGAALAAGAGEMVKCTFCNTTARVPGRFAARQQQSNNQPPPMEPFWLLVDGPSPGRMKLIRGKSEDDDDEDSADEFEAMNARATALARAHAPHAYAPSPYGYVQPHAQKKSSTMIIVIVIALVALLVLVGAGVAAALLLGQN